jgi:hypothetical protein
VKEPAELARQVEEHPQLPPATCERVSGYGVMGLPFRSGHVLGLRRWTASSLGEGYTSIWHRDSAGRWTFYQSAPAEIACTRYFGADVERVQIGPIAIGKATAASTSAPLSPRRSTGRSRWDRRRSPA